VEQADSFARLPQQLLHDVVVKLRPIPGGLELPAVDDVAHEIDGVGFVMAQEVEQLVGLAAARPQMDVRQKQRSNPPRASREPFKHSSPCAWRAYQCFLLQTHDPRAGGAALAGNLLTPALTALLTDWIGRAGLSCRHTAAKPHPRLNRHVFDPMFERSVRP